MGIGVRGLSTKASGTQIRICIWGKGIRKSAWCIILWVDFAVNLMQSLWKSRAPGHRGDGLPKERADKETRDQDGDQR